MNYGLYLSATGVLANTYRQDVIANNLANAETVGFKRHLATFQQRPVESHFQGRPDLSDPTLDNIGGGFLVAPTQVDTSQGEFEPTGNNLDAAIFGNGFFAVQNKGKTQLTRLRIVHAEQGRRIDPVQRRRPARSRYGRSAD